MGNPGGVWRRRLRLAGAGLAALAAAALLFGAGAVTAAAGLRHFLQQFHADLDRIVSPDGIDEARYVEIGGVRQWITVRGQDRSKPILLFLHGGPGGALSDIAYEFARPWEDYFVVVQWDQRGYGRSNVDADKIRGTTTKERYIADAIELADYLRKRFDRPKIVLVGQSWGTLLGTEVAHRRPDMLYALVSIGQLTGWESSYEEIRRLLLDLGKRTGDRALADKMTKAGPVPVGPKAGPFLAAMDPVWEEMNRRGYSWHAVTGSDDPIGELFDAAAFTSPTIDDRRFLSLLRGGSGNDYYATLHPTLSGWSLERDVGTRMAVPYVLIMGRFDWQTPIPLARQYYEEVCAPYKAYVELPNAAHVAMLEQPGLVTVALVEKVLPAVSGNVPAGAETCAAAAAPGGST
ncbi:MAG TPA: alpha/beta hydrolase [Steroidobacteraceae bacterium]|jgi:pimeloyl-ACP methyl ester carboxylesterase|nr:alpha/beta hydrolase [Steroidobacteraceae bacterium]